MFKGLPLALMRHDVAVRHRAIEWDMITTTREHIGGAIKTSQVAGARSDQTGIGALASPQSEIHQPPPSGGDDRARRLGCDQRRQSNLIHNQALGQLRLNQRTGNFKNRFIGKKDGALRYRIHLTGKAKITEEMEELRLEEFKRIKRIERRLAETELL